MIQLTDTAITKVNEILGTQEPKPAGLRISVVGGGCVTILVVLLVRMVWPQLAGIGPLHTLRPAEDIPATVAEKAEA